MMNSADDNKASGEPSNIEPGDNNKITEDDINQEIKDNKSNDNENINNPLNEMNEIDESIPDRDKGINDPEELEKLYDKFQIEDDE